jgi:hypothetical protein
VSARVRACGRMCVCVHACMPCVRACVHCRSVACTPCRCRHASLMAQVTPERRCGRAC